MQGLHLEADLQAYNGYMSSAMTCVAAPVFMYISLLKSLEGALPWSCLLKCCDVTGAGAIAERPASPGEGGGIILEATGSHRKHRGHCRRCIEEEVS